MSEEKTAVNEVESLIREHARSLLPSDRKKAVQEAAAIFDNEKQNQTSKHVNQLLDEEHDLIFIPSIEDENIIDFIEQLPEKREELAGSIVLHPQRKEHVLVLEKEAPVSKIEIPLIEMDGESIKLSIDTNGKSAGTVIVSSDEIQYNSNGTKSQAVNSLLKLTPDGGLKFERNEYNYKTGEPHQVTAVVVPAKEGTSNLTLEAFQHINKLINQAKPPQN